MSFQWVDVAVAGVLLLAVVAVVLARPVEASLPTSGVVTGGEAVEGLADVPEGAALCPGYGVGNSPAGGISPLLGWLQPASDAMAMMMPNRYACFIKRPSFGWLVVAFPVYCAPRVDDYPADMKKPAAWATGFSNRE